MQEAPDCPVYMTEWCHKQNVQRNEANVPENSKATTLHIIDDLYGHMRQTVHSFPGHNPVHHRQSTRTRSSRFRGTIWPAVTECPHLEHQGTRMPKALRNVSHCRGTKTEKQKARCFRIVTKNRPWIEDGTGGRKPPDGLESQEDRTGSLLIR